MSALSPLTDREIELLRGTIGARCARARIVLGLSQRELARRMDRSPSWVREIEQGEQFAPAYLLKSLASAVNVSVAWFYGDEHVPRLEVPVHDPSAATDGRDQA